MTKKYKTCGNPGCPVQGLVRRANEDTCTVIYSGEIEKGIMFNLFSCGHEAPSADWSTIKYCPECGKRVVSDEQC